jgi:hypothetical protein
MYKGNRLYLLKRIFLFSFFEKMVQMIWYFFWIILLVRQRTKLAPQVVRK